ncbi:hypothetical protein NQ317_002441 [Molorchus minor]|uniref:Myb-like domain-containing protein n=1 Tax=Molorchus minor TaxID=1323400 RepID=A0ABQ9J8C2_9CUCU|nr:hypothetical protein NQ317_002441 [Molorchus minor]
MASDDHEYVFLNKEDGEAEDASYIKTIMDLPEVEISEDVQIEDEHDDEDLTRKEPEEPWEESKVKQLLGLYLQNFDKFQNPKIRKSTLWRKIGLAVGRDGDSCDRKYRNIKQHYCTIRKKERIWQNDQMALLRSPGRDPP